MDDEKECNQAGVFVRRILENDCEFTECVEEPQGNGKDRKCFLPLLVMMLCMIGWCN